LTKGITLVYDGDIDHDAGHSRKDCVAGALAVAYYESSCCSKNESDEIYQLRTTQVLEWKTMDPLPLGGVTWLVSTTWEDIGRGCHDLQLRCSVNEMIPGWMREDIRGSNGITMLTSVVMKDS
jgi:hypothetical protein